MCTPLLFVACLLLSVLSGAAPTLASDDASAAQRAEVIRRHGLDPASALESRVQETPASVLKMFEEAGHAAPTAHVLTEQERRKLAEAFAALPPLHQRILRERLRSVSFLDGMPNTGLTSPVNPDEPYQLFHITLRAAILHQTASEWLTEKERTVFQSAGSPLSVSIEAGKRDALVFVLFHEATHVVDFALEVTPHFRPGERSVGGEPSTAFTRGIWSDYKTPAPTYRDSLRESVRFRPGGQTLPIDQAEAVYTSLRQTPFVSLYGGSNWYDDLAEYVSVYHWTQVFRQPYRIVLRNGGKEVLVYEPMKSDRVRSRIDQMKRFYEKERPDGTPPA